MVNQQMATTTTTTNDNGNHVNMAAPVRAQSLRSTSTNKYTCK